MHRWRNVKRNNCGWTAFFYFCNCIDANADASDFCENDEIPYGTRCCFSTGSYGIDGVQNSETLSSDEKYKQFRAFGTADCSEVMEIGKRLWYTNERRDKNSI